MWVSKNSADSHHGSWSSLPFSGSYHFISFPIIAQIQIETTRLCQIQKVLKCCPCLIQDGVEFLLVLTSRTSSKFHGVCPLQKFQECHVFLNSIEFPVSEFWIIFMFFILSYHMSSYHIPLLSLPFTMAIWWPWSPRRWFPVPWQQNTCIYVKIICLCVHVYICIYMYIYICVYIYMYIYMYIYIYMISCIQMYPEVLLSFCL